MNKKIHVDLVKRALAKPNVKKEYDTLGNEFELLNEMIKARIRSGKTQSEVAKAMKTSTSVVGRLETAGGKHKHSPTIETLRKYAKALGCDLEVKFVQHNKR